jgi:Tfp pilus assembly protein PilF
VSGPIVRILVLVVAVGIAGAARAATPAAVAANETGVALFRAGTVAAAAAKFEEALALDPGLEPARHNLAAALARLGDEDLRAGNLDDARTRLERAVTLAPREADLHLLLGVLHSRRGNLYEARQSIDRSLELAPDVAAAREVSGDLYYQEGALARARAEWEQALSSTGAHQQSLRAKIERAGRELDAEGAFARDVSRHFTIQYDGPVPREVARTALHILEQTYDRLWREFGRAPQQDLPVILYSRALFDEITRSPAWVGGTYDGKIRVPVGGLRTESDAQRLAPILAHELTHAFVRANVPDRLPLWFEEGLAVYLEGAPPEAANLARRASAAGFTSLEGVSAALRSGSNISAAYAAAGLAIADMVRLDGFWLPSRTLQSMATGRSFAESFRAAAGLEFAEFEELWRRSLQ